ncbi:hypothetical protein, partial [Klebsiella pneumoniae]|uniref:hypothetical protein n=1 Tax=Klebsiella pneumoniae TaxID=573 RepID=UPI00210CE7F3
LRFLREVVNDNILPLQAFANGSRRPPIAGSLLIWQKVTEVLRPLRSQVSANVPAIMTLREILDGRGRRCARPGQATISSHGRLMPIPMAKKMPHSSG